MIGYWTLRDANWAIDDWTCSVMLTVFLLLFSASSLRSLPLSLMNCAGDAF